MNNADRKMASQGPKAVVAKVEEMPSLIPGGVDPDKVLCTGLSNATFATLVAAVNTHLAGSTNRLLDVKFYAGGIVTLLHYAVVIELTP